MKVLTGADALRHRQAYFARRAPASQIVSTGASQHSQWHTSGRCSIRVLDRFENSNHKTWKGRYQQSRLAHKTKPQRNFQARVCVIQKVTSPLNSSLSTIICLLLTCQSTEEREEERAHPISIRFPSDLSVILHFLTIHCHAKLTSPPSSFPSTMIGSLLACLASCSSPRKRGVRSSPNCTRTTSISRGVSSCPNGTRTKRIKTKRTLHCQLPENNQLQLTSLAAIKECARSLAPSKKVLSGS